MVLGEDSEAHSFQQKLNGICEVLGKLQQEGKVIETFHEGSVTIHSRQYISEIRLTRCGCKKVE